MTDAILMRDYALSNNCPKCGAQPRQPCHDECHTPTPLGPALIRVMPCDDHDPNPDIHPPPVPTDLRRVL